MKDNIQEPTCTQRDTLHGDTFEHPAFATISAARVSGHTDLFGSNLGHNGFVRVEITEARLTRNLMHDYIGGVARTIASVDMSEAQWVQFISRMNVGSGTPCTLRVARDGDLTWVPQLPPQGKPSDKLDDVVREQMEVRKREIDEKAATIRDIAVKLPAKTRDAILKQLSLLTQHLIANAEFAHKQLTGHKETLVGEAKVEFDAMLRGALQTLGLDSLQQLAGAERDARERMAGRLPELPHEGGES